MRVRIPTVLHSYTGARSTVDVQACSRLDDVMQDLDRQFPGLRFRIIDEQDNIRPHIKIFVNREQVRDLSTTLATSDEIAIVQAFSGG